MHTASDESSQNDFQTNQDLSSQDCYNGKNILSKKSDGMLSQKSNSNDPIFLTLKEQADNGSAEDQFQIGCFYEDGKSIWIVGNHKT